MVSEGWVIFLIVFQFIVGFYVGFCLNGIRHRRQQAGRTVQRQCMDRQAQTLDEMPFYFPTKIEDVHIANKAIPTKEMFMLWATAGMWDVQTTDNGDGTWKQTFTPKGADEDE
jgi:hypothetical protein